jgi:hypothetical protein
LTTARSIISLQGFPVKRSVILTIALFATMTPLALAQATDISASTEAMVTTPDLPVLTGSSALPDSPGAVFFATSSSAMPEDSIDSDDPSTPTARPMARPQVKLISANRTAPTQTAGDKVLMGLREAVTPYSVIGWFISAGWAQLIDGSPNYGTNSEAFAKRLGASAALASSRGIFGDSILGPVFHQDTRYYQLGRSHKFINRVIYAGTRTIIGKTDSGRAIPNYAFLIATAGSSGLTVTYYPDRNTSGSQVFQTFATSVGGAALGNLVSEFGGDVIQALHLSRRE